MRSVYCLMVFTFFGFFSASAQVSSDSLTVARAVTHLSKLYYDSKKGESLLYVGSDYAEYDGVADEHPYYLENDWLLGNVEYNDNSYRDVPLQYDLSQQKLLTEHATSGKRMQLVSEHVSKFSIQSHQFENLSESYTKGIVPAGFYEVLADGNVRLLARRGKALQESTASGKLEARFEESVKYFVYKDGTFHQVKRKSSILNVFKDKKAMLNKELKQKRIKFNTDKESALVQTVLLYNSIADR